MSCSDSVRPYPVQTVSSLETLETMVKWTEIYCICFALRGHSFPKFLCPWLNRQPNPISMSIQWYGREWSLPAKLWSPEVLWGCFLSGVLERPLPTQVALPCPTLISMSYRILLSSFYIGRDRSIVTLIIIHSTNFYWTAKLDAGNYSWHQEWTR